MLVITCRAPRVVSAVVIAPKGREGKEMERSGTTFGTGNHSSGFDQGRTRSDGKPVLNRELVQATRAVLLSSRKGVPLHKFCIDYEKLVGERFPYRRYGYSTASELLRALEGVVKFVENGDKRNGGCWLYGIPDGTSFNPSWVKKAAAKTDSVRHGLNQEQALKVPQEDTPSTQKSPPCLQLFDGSLFVLWKNKEGVRPGLPSEKQKATKVGKLVHCWEAVARNVYIEWNACMIG